MTDKEHLKYVKELINKYENCYDKDTALKYAVDLMRNSARYFIEQAERVQELEEELYGNDMQVGYKYMYEVCNRDYVKLLEQNKRYREAREIIEQVYKDNYVRNTHGYEGGYLDGLDTAMDIIDKALEGKDELEW